LNKFLGILSLAFCINLYSAQEAPIIPNSSYFVYNYVDHSEDCKFVNFYTFNGDLIEKIENNFPVNEMYQRLDPNAGKPRPTHYLITDQPREWNGCSVMFFDKHNNQIISCFYEGLEFPELITNEVFNIIISKTNPGGLRIAHDYINQKYVGKTAKETLDLSIAVQISLELRRKSQKPKCYCAII
jgi:hypothetical protein